MEKLFLFTHCPWVMAFVMLSLLSDQTYGNPCTFKPPCSCSSPDFVVDLSPMMQRRSSPLKVMDEETSYFLNPCGARLNITECSSLVNAAGCQYQDKKPYGIAKTTGYTANGDPTKGTVRFLYSFNSDLLRKTVLNINCDSDQDGDFSFIKESPQLTYNFLLKTRFACKPVSNSHKLSLGSILLIIFFVLLIVYFVGGFLIQKFVRKAEGKEVIPNYVFWRELPLLIKDGGVFTISKLRGSTTYEKI